MHSLPHKGDWIDPRIYKQNPTELELAFAHHWVSLYPEIDLHYQYPLVGYPRSKWDYAHPQSKVGIELQGGLWVAHSGHRSASGVRADLKKQQRAAEYGWVYLPLSTEDVQDPYKLTVIYSVIQGRLNAQ